jgi:hypothetical protein
VSYDRSKSAEGSRNEIHDLLAALPWRATTIAPALSKAARSPRQTDQRCGLPRQAGFNRHFHLCDSAQTSGAKRLRASNQFRPAGLTPTAPKIHAAPWSSAATHRAI